MQFPLPDAFPGHFLNAVWPIGSVFVAVVSTDPATLIGFGTWQALGAGRCLVGYDAADSDFNAAEKTGGAKTHALTVAEMPAHTHVQQVNTASTGPLSGYTADTSTNTPAASGISTQSTGGGAAHNNLQPYYVVHMWRRIA